MNMNMILAATTAAFKNFARNKIRTFLTSLGILIGVLSVVLLIAIGLGLKNYISDQFNSIGTNLLFIAPGKFLQSGLRPGGGALGGVEFDEQDVRNLDKSKHLEYVAPAFIKTIELSYKGQTELGDLVASNEDVVPVLNLEVEKGRLLKKTDILKRNKVVVLGSKIVEELFPAGLDPIGKKIKLEGQSVKIIGIITSKGGSGLGSNRDSQVYMPYTATYSFNPSKTFFAIYAKSYPESQMKMAKKDIVDILTKRYDKGDFSVLEQKEILDTVNSVFSMINMVLVSIGAISLLVGGIGIMNIMYVSVVERVREIGIRRAIGATKQDILIQFVAEAVLLSLIGGIAGIVLSSIIVLIIRQFFPASLNLMAIAIAFFVSSFIGIIFGVFPARKAANLTPVEAIRYE